MSDQKKERVYIKKEDIEKAKDLLRSLPEKERSESTRRQAFSDIYEEINGALNSGYSLEDILQVLSQANPELAGVKLSTVKMYLAEERKKEKERKADKFQQQKSKKAKPKSENQQTDIEDAIASSKEKDNTRKPVQTRTRAASKAAKDSMKADTSHAGFDEDV